MTEVLLNCLNDYTNDQQRGDIGSSVRRQAIDAASFAVQTHIIPQAHNKEILVLRICALATELLDDVRIHAALRLKNNWQTFGLAQFSCP